MDIFDILLIAISFFFLATIAVIYHWYCKRRLNILKKATENNTGKGEFKEVK